MMGCKRRFFHLGGRRRLWTVPPGLGGGAVRIACAVCLLLLLWAPPESARGGLMDFSIQDEVELGKEFNVLIRTQFPVIHDPVINGYLNDLLHRISSAMPPQPFPLNISLVKDKSLNAFAAPAGYLFLHTGLILAMEQEAELAGVIAHELAHVSQRHLAERIGQSKLIALGTLAGMLAGAMLGGTGDLGQAVSMGSVAGGQAAALKYTRDNEREADQIGLNYLVGSGFNGSGMLQSFKRIQEHNLLGGVNRPPDYMLTHPGIPERIHSLEDRLAGQNQDQGDDHGADGPSEFLKIQMLIRSKYADAAQAVSHYQNLDKPLGCLDSLGMGIALERQNRVRQAESYFQKTLHCPDLGSLVHRELGRFYFLIGNYAKGLTFLDTAIAAEPDDYLSLYYKARILTEIDELDRAVTVLERIRIYLPEVSEIHTLLGQVYGRRGDSFKGFLHLAYSALFANRKAQTEHYLEKVRPLAQTESQQEALKAFMDRYSQRKKFW